MALIGLASLARASFSGGDLAPVGARLLALAERNPLDADVLMDLSTVLQLRGHGDLGLALQAQALRLSRSYTLGPGDGLRVLALLRAGDLAENNAIEFLLEESGIALELLYISRGESLPSPMPEHDVLFVAVCETDLNRPLLRELERALAHWPRPVVNRPGRIARLSRDGAASMIGAIRGAVVPKTVRLGRDALRRIGEETAPAPGKGDGFAFIARPVDSHKGRGLAKLENPAAVLAYLDSRDESLFYLSPFVDYRSADGLYRKYRIVLIGGRPFVCHMAISEQWIVHYMTARMDECAARRAEEARFMATFDAAFGRRHRRALEAIARRVGLDYVGLDCGETRDGRLLVFEVDSGMTVHAMDDAGLYPYKPAQMRKVFAAFRGMLRKAGRQAPPATHQCTVASTSVGRRAAPLLATAN